MPAHHCTCSNSTPRAACTNPPYPASRRILRGAWLRRSPAVARPPAPNEGHEPWKSAELAPLLQITAKSHQKLLGRPILPDLTPDNIVEKFWNAPCTILIHDGVGSGVPARFVYVNAECIRVFEGSWQGLVGALSTVSAAPDQNSQQLRNKFLDDVAQKGWGYTHDAVRMSQKGRPIRIHEGLLYNIEDDAGRPVGQAAVITKFEYMT